jgi:uncharacterized protein DUF4185
MSISNQHMLKGCLAFAAFAALAGLTACGGGQGSQDSGSRGTGGPLQGALTVQATDLGPLPQNTDILGRDEAYSASFQGYSIWLYGDTGLQKKDASGRNFLSNTWSYTSNFNGPPIAANFQERLDSVGSPTPLLQETPDEYSYDIAHYWDNCQSSSPDCGARWGIWPSTMITDPATGFGLVFYMLEWLDPVGNFTEQGTSVAIWKSFGQLPLRPSFNPAIVPGHSDLMFSSSETGFGAGAVISNGLLYVYGCHHADGPDKSCQVARVSPATVQDKTTWTYYAGNGTWSSNENAAVTVFIGLDIMSVSWNNYLQRYVAVYNALSSQDVVLRTAPAPEGPWTDELVAFTSMLNSDGSNAYDAQAHSEFDANGGQTIYVTYTQNLSSGSVIHVVSLNLKLVGALP